MTREQIEAHSLRRLAKEYLSQVCKLYQRAELLEPIKTQKRIEEAMRTLAQCVPELKALLQKENDAIDALTAKLNDASTAGGTQQQQIAQLQQQLADAQKQLADAQAAVAANADALAALNALLDANAPAPSAQPAAPVAQTPAGAPAVTTFQQ